MSKEDIFMTRLVLAQSDIKAFVSSLLPFHAEAVPDIVQETDLALLAARDRYHPEMPFMPWAITFAKHRIQEYLHDNQRNRVLFSSEIIDRLSDLYVDPQTEPVGKDNREGLLNRMKVCRSKLKERDRLLLSLFYDNKMPIREIAHRLKRHEESIRVTLSTIRGKLGTCLRRLCKLTDEEFERQERTAMDRAVDAAVEGNTPSDALLQEAAAEAAALDDETLRGYLDQFRVHAILSEGAAPALAAASRVSFSTPAPPKRLPIPRWMMALAASLVLLLGGAAFFWFRPTADSIATIASAYYAVSLDGCPCTTRAALRPGTWRWSNGLIELNMKGGTRVLVEAPASIRAFSATRLQLYSGNVTVKMEKGRNGFVIDTPRVRLLDLGTEFGVSVSPDGESRVQVFDGKVLATSNLQPVEKTLTEGEAITTDSDGAMRDIAFRPDFFVRRMSYTEHLEPCGLVFNTPRYDHMKAIPAEKPVVIDGHLDEWPTNVTFRSACEPPYDKAYTVESHVMYDATNLYLGVVVGDPDPLRNRNAENRMFHFAGGSVIFRFACRNSLSVPSSPTYAGGSLANEPETDRQLRSLVCWYDLKSEAPMLDILVGMNHFNNIKEPSRSDGWDGVFRKHPDGLGYTLEYAVSWSLLGTTAPRPGEQRLNHWNIHWSNEDGRICIG